MNEPAPTSTTDGTSSAPVRRVINLGFRRKIILLVVCALGIAQISTFTAVLVAARGNVIKSSTSDLDVAEKVFDRLLHVRFLQLSDSVNLLAADFGFKKVVATGDEPTMRSALENHIGRADADLAALISLDGEIISSTVDPPLLKDGSDWHALVESAARKDVRSSFVLVGTRLYQVVVAPVRMPAPAAWLFMGFRVDDALAAELKDVTALDVTFFGVNARGTVDGASTLTEGPRRALAAILEHSRGHGFAIAPKLLLGDDEYMTRTRTFGDGARVIVFLQKSLTLAFASFEALKLQLLIIFGLTLALAVLGGVILVNGVTGPIRKLAQAAARIGEGNYGVAIDVETNDEVGQLGATLDAMQFEIAEREHRIVHQAHHDDLTGLPNRWLLNDRLAGAIRRSDRDGKPLSVVMMDVDRFKQINDSLGHHIGDLALKETARRLVQQLRQSDTVARLGGDDFFLILERSDARECERILKQKFIGELSRPIDLEEMDIALNFSFGIAEYPGHADSATELLRRAEIAMYDAKAAHTRFVTYHPGRDEGHIRQLKILGDLAQGLRNDQFSLYFQPKVDLKTEQVAHAEALVRWIHPQLGFLPPDEFIPVIEQSGNMLKLSAWIVDCAVRQCRAWLDQDLEIQISVNLSAEDLLSPQLTSIVFASLVKYKVPPRLLAFEITESAVIRDPKAAIEQLDVLRQAGLWLSIDDFGTGYSSLAQVKGLPVDELKIDKSFVLNLRGGTDDAVIVKSTADLAHSMSLEVVAEGVETEEGLALLREYGCDKAQGYLISKPLPAAEFFDWHAAHHRAGRFYRAA